MSSKREAIVPRELIERVLDAAGPQLIVVGGQALAFWMDRYGIEMPPSFSYVSRDLDFLAPSANAAADVRRLARALGGRAELPKRRGALTALVGQAVKDISDDEYFNVDVVHRVFGADESLKDRAVEITRANGQRFRLIHPLDVLKSRLDNLYGLREKQNELGKAQLIAAIAVAQAFQREASEAQRSGMTTSRPTSLRHVGFIERLATGDAGRKVARRYGIHVADAIEPSTVPSRTFHTKALPKIMVLMSTSRRRELARASREVRGRALPR